jgi:hypothetical protein
MTFVPNSRRPLFQEQVKDAIRKNIPVTGAILKNPSYLEQLRREVEMEPKHEEDIVTILQREIEDADRKELGNQETYP